MKTYLALAVEMDGNNIIDTMEMSCDLQMYIDDNTLAAISVGIAYETDEDNENESVVFWLQYEDNADLQQVMKDFVWLKEFCEEVEWNHYELRLITEKN